MKTKRIVSMAATVSFAAQMIVRSATFDFENAPAGSGLPLDLTVGGITAHFSSTGLGGFYIQTPQNTILYSPAGFSGNCLVPSSVYGADLHIDFSQALTNCSVLYSPQELACDSSARMRITAYMNGVQVGTSTTTAETPGTWPSATLAFNSTQSFNSVVVHYDAPPPTGGDYGVIFLADNVTATLAPAPPEPPLLHISNAGRPIRIGWSTNSAAFTLQSSANLAVASAWVPVSIAPHMDGNQLVVDLPPDAPANFYRLVLP